MRSRRIETAILSHAAQALSNLQHSPTEPRTLRIAGKSVKNTGADPYFLGKSCACGGYGGCFRKRRIGRRKPRRAVSVSNSCRLTLDSASLTLRRCRPRAA